MRLATRYIEFQRAPLRETHGRFERARGARPGAQHGLLLCSSYCAYADWFTTPGSELPLHFLMYGKHHLATENSRTHANARKRLPPRGRAGNARMVGAPVRRVVFISE